MPYSMFDVHSSLFQSLSMGLNEAHHYTGGGSITQHFPHLAAKHFT